MEGDPGPGPGVEVIRATGSGLVRLIGRSGYDLKVSGRHHIPRHSAAVLAINHFSHLDAVLATHVAGRNVRYLAVDELFGESGFFDWLVGFFGAIPMSRRRPPLGALRTALGVLADGGLVGLFPEGRRVTFWGESPHKEGAAWLALRTDVPLIPISIIGTHSTLSVKHRGMHRGSIWVAALPPLLPADYRDAGSPRTAMTRAWGEAIAGQVEHWNPDD